ncbi:MAG: hypothetical protein DSM106950_31735 [Stigonema ocellatum SAG 48.90 = DSM 106950]|nr:hypothetical protein [Stigonema ocellatum SAG 48.90 = DSM 106950]
MSKLFIIDGLIQGISQKFCLRTQSIRWLLNAREANFKKGEGRLYSALRKTSIAILFEIRTPQVGATCK